MNKQYLGDSVYVETNGYGLTLTTENGDGPSNKIFLEPSVYNNLTEFVAWLKQESSAKAEGK